MRQTKAIFAAALHALTNMGHRTPEERDLRAIRERIDEGGYNLADAVDGFCGPLYESDNDEEIFQDEAVGWYQQFEHMSTAEFVKSYPRSEYAWRHSFPRRWEAALQINEGAVNIIPIASAIADAAREVNDEPRDTSNHNDEAIRLMAHQLAHLTQVGAVMGMKDYNRCVEKCTTEAAAVKALRDDPEPVPA